MALVDRRQAILGGAGALVAFGLGAIAARSRRKGATPFTPLPPGGPRDLEVLDWTFPTPDGERRVVVLVPRPLPAGQKLPLLVALHGRGETASPRAGAYGWLESYRLDRSYAALRSPPLTAELFEGFVRQDRLARLNADLTARAFGGLVVACPALPPEIGGGMYDRYASFLADALLPRLRKETPILGTKESTGIDGVSLGGISALRMGISRPDLFGAIGALQPAIIEDPAEGHVVDAIVKGLGGRPLRLVTSDEDVYYPAVTKASARLTELGVSHQLLVTMGPHDYVWNRGPGGIEMLLYHDRALRGLPAV
ncbi:MAG: esterase [Myxococcales bacterium]|nr:esterase [Myxococcales bacterium]